MLPRARRLRRSGDFTATFRQGSRAGSPSVVVHVAVGRDDPSEATRVGFVVSKAVGNAVVRNRVKRRLRHLVIGLPSPAAADIVVRALPPAATEPGRLVSDLQSAWGRAFDKAMGKRATC
ncbi:MAG: ribonuclease P protein component [Propionibacteriaceae bacterium]|nr:ribonuclease P protein component [Propionibacteriaceae bacterium]